MRHLNAIVSPHPYDLQAVAPVAEFDLSKYRFVEEVDIVSGLDSRPDLLKMAPTAFEHLVRQTLRSHRTGSLDHPGQPRRRRSTPSPSTATP
ncbi:hypothetical protein [Streptacidiphilus sp. PAMC 29251]